MNSLLMSQIDFKLITAILMVTRMVLEVEMTQGVNIDVDVAVTWFEGMSCIGL